MSGVYYTYRVRVANPERVQVEKRNLQGDSLGEPNGAFGYKGPLRHKIDNLVRAAQSGALRGSRIKELGEALFQALFDDGLCHDFVGLYNQVVHDEDKLLRVELDVDEQELPEVAALPWEFMRLPTSANLGTIWLGTAPDLIFSRRRAHWFVPKRIRLEPGEKLRIALAVAAPSDLGPVAYEEMWEALEKLAQEQVDRIELMELVNPATSEAIYEVLAQKPHIFHFIGHGRLLEEDERQTGQLALVDELGEASWVKADDFNDLFSQHRPGVVFLQACEGGSLSPSQAFVGVASRVVQQNVPVVVAMQYPVSNSTASRFARHFYQRLAKDVPVDRAVQEGRRHIAWATKPYEARDFATPVLFMRVPDGHLFQRSEVEDVSKAEDPSLFDGKPKLELLRLYDRGEIFERVKNKLSDKRLGVWVKANRRSGRTPLAMSLVRECVGSECRFEKWDYFSARTEEGKSKGQNSFSEFAYKAIRDFHSDTTLFIIDDWEYFCYSERRRILDDLDIILHEPLHKAIVISAFKPEQPQGWCQISLKDYLKEDEIQQFVDEYAEDLCPHVEKALKSIGKNQWVKDLCEKTKVQANSLWTFLDYMSCADTEDPSELQEYYRKALDAARNPSEAKNPIVQMLERWDSDRKRVVKALSLFEGSVSLDRLTEILSYSKNHLNSLLDELLGMRLVKKLSSNEDPRYKLAIQERETVMPELGEDDPLLRAFFEEWLNYVKKYGGKNRRKYPKLGVERDNIQGVLRIMWSVAKIQVHSGYEADQIKEGEPLPSDAFKDIEPTLQRESAKHYIELLDYLRDYFRFEGWWRDYNHKDSERYAYAAACALNDVKGMSQGACRAANAHSHEEWHTDEDLRIAEKWVEIMENINEEERFRTQLPGMALRMRGVIAMRRHRYQESHDHFQDALEHFEKWGLVKQMPDILFYLAKLEMRYNPDYKKGRSYKRALEYLDRAQKCLERTLEDLEQRLEYLEQTDSKFNINELGKQEVNDTISDLQEVEAVNRMQKVELLIWWGRWPEAALELEKALSRAKKLGRKDLIAKCHYLKAFRHQSEHLLYKAIKRANDALDIQQSATAPDRSLYLCRIYAVLAALYQSGWKLAGEVENEKQFRDHLDKLDRLLKARRELGPLKQREKRDDPEADYEAACLKVLEGDMDRALDTLKGVVEIQPGCVIRAENDFRLDPLTQGAYRAKWEAVKAGLKSGEDSG